MTTDALSLPVDDARPAEDDRILVQALRSGDEAAFAAIVDRYHVPLVRLGRSMAFDHMAAEELAQETWLALVRGIDRFESRSTLKTWLFHVLAYKARERMQRDHRLRWLSLDDEPSVSPGRFRPEGEKWAGHWAVALADWRDLPEDRLEEQELLETIRSILATLPPKQRSVLVLRDVEGLSASEVCDILQVSDGSERVLLHRARARVRQGLATYLNGE